MNSRPDLRPDPGDIHGDAWEVYEVTPDYRRSRLWLDDTRTSCIIRTEHLADEALAESNRQQFNDSHGKRFGDGKIVARVPLNKFYAELAAKIREGDKDHAKWWLNSDEARPFRTFRGRL